MKHLDLKSTAVAGIVGIILMLIINKMRGKGIGTKDAAYGFVFGAAVQTSVRFLGVS